MLKMFLKFFVILFIFFSFSCFAYAQKISLATKSFVKKNTVLLRWAPIDKELWNLGVKYGYKIERITLSSVSIPDSTTFRSSTLLTSQSLRPRSNKDTSYWQTLIKQNRNAAILYSFLYPKVDKKPVTPKQKETVDQILYGLMLISCDHSTDIAKAAALFFNDSTANNNSIYAYRIQLFNAPKNISLKQTIVVVDSRLLTALPKIDSLSGSFSKKRVELHWNVRKNKNDYSGYIIERSDDSTNFIAINKTPYVLASTEYEKERNYADYSDSISKLNNTYFYRICGLTHFGELGPTGNIIRVKTKVEINGFPIIDSTKSISNKRTIIFWKMPEAFDIKTLKGFVVSRSLKANGQYSFIGPSLLPPTALQFTDENSLYINYYKICAISTGGDSAYSFPAMVQPEDREPPQIPKGISGSIDKSGVVKLQWVSNDEIDLRGYRVFRGNSPTEEFVEATKKIIGDTIFADTININTLTKSIYYSIVAVDFVYNNSDYSIPIKLARPDKLPPVAAPFVSLYFDSHSINIKWIRSSSDDISKYTLERQDKDQPTKTTIIKEWPANDTVTFFIDTAITEANTYTYILSTIDSSNNISRVVSSPIYFETGVRKKISTLSAIVNRTEKMIELKWQYQKPAIQNFILYKSKKGEPLRVLKTLSPGVNSFSDIQPYINNVYFYAIKAVFTNGAESELSDVLELVY
jgi:hypothetical protein